MLSLLRRGGFIQFVMAAIVMVIIAAFAFDYRGGSTSLEQECVIRMARVCVPPKDFFSAFRLAVPPQLEPEQVRAQGLRQHVIDGLVERELLLGEARKLGVGVSDEEVDKELAQGRVHYSLPVARYTLGMSRRFELEPNEMLTYIPVKNPKTQGFDFKVYKRSVLNVARMSTKDFKEKQEAELVAARMRALISSQVRVSESEAFAQFSREGSKAVARIAHVPRDWFLRFTVTDTKQREQQFATSNATEIDAAWEQEKSAYTAGCADISEIVIDTSSVSEEERAQAKKKLEDAKTKISSAEDFAVFAAALSTSSSAAHHGRLGCVAVATDDADAVTIQEAIKGLSPNQVSGVVSTEANLRLLRLNARLSETEMASVGRQLLVKKLTREAVAAEQAEQFAKQLLELAKAGTSLEQAVSAQATVALHNVGPAAHRKFLQKAALELEQRPKFEVSASFSVGANPLPDALAGSPAAQLFALPNIDEFLPAPLATAQGFAVLQLKEKTAVTREEFDEKKSKLLRELRLRKQADALVSYVKRLRDQMQTQIQVDDRYLKESSNATEDG